MSNRANGTSGDPDRHRPIRPSIQP
jgi:hypothetical protein